MKYRTGHGNLSKKLLDRVDTATSIMDRACARYGVAEDLAPEVVAEGYASTCRTMGYVLRASEPREAAKWYLRALAWPAGRLASAKGLVASLLRLASGRRTTGSPENATANVYDAVVGLTPAGITALGVRSTEHGPAAPVVVG